MYLVQLFSASPLAAIALCICLASILWCIFLTHRYPSSVDKLLAGLIGLIAIYQALRVLRDSGVAVFSRFHKLDGWADFMVANLYLIAVMMLKISSMDRARTRVHLRLVEANEKPAEISRKIPAISPEMVFLLFDASPLATFATGADDNVIYWNSAAEDLLGWTREELLGRALPFPLQGGLINKRGEEVDAAVWTTPVVSSTGAQRATLVIAASAAARRQAGYCAVAGFRTPSGSVPASGWDVGACASILLGWNPRM
ncbi:MAG TPA: PAS domain S-box protein [Bryobacteraceae bacterium]|nr:PAS domain S-box protein [Bryobacteraceae bacterium]